MPRGKDLTGQQFGKLFVIGKDLSKGTSPTYWLCQCECGKQVSRRTTRLNNKAVRSCGCYVANKTHGMGNSPEYHAWADAKRRCTDTTNEHYAGRGISMCEEWFNSFEAFYDHIGARPTDKHSLDRIDNNGNYEPGNVQWTTQSNQRLNSRSLNNTSGTKGVSYDKRTGKWKAYYKGDIGRFPTYEEAVAARLKAEQN